MLKTERDFIPQDNIAPSYNKEPTLENEINLHTNERTSIGLL